MIKPVTGRTERQQARVALLSARAAIDEALRELGEDRWSEIGERSLGSLGATGGDVSALRAPAPPAASYISGGDTPMTLGDLDVAVLEGVTASLPAVFDTYHVVEHPDFRAAHRHLLDRPALNQLAGKVLRRNAPVLRLAYLGPRGRRRSALWQRQEL